MIELGLPPAVVAAEVEKLATEGSLGDSVRHISRRRVGDSTWLLQVSCEGGGRGSMRVESTAAVIPDSEGSAIWSEPVPGNDDSSEWHATLEKTVWRALVALMSQGRLQQLASVDSR